MKYGKARLYSSGKVHCIEGVDSRIWSTICGCSIFKFRPHYFIVTEDPVDCKTCLRMMEKNDEIQPKGIPKEVYPPGIKGDD